MSAIRSQALRNLLGADVAWKFVEDELIIYTEGINAPTKTAINAEIARLEAQEQQAKAEAQFKREAALAKLAALGLEPDDLAALGL